MNILTRLFTRRLPAMTVKESLAQSPHDAWPKLAAMGYELKSYGVAGGKRCYSFWLGGGMVSDEWSRPLSIDEMTDMREQWAQAELQRLEELKANE